MLHGQPIYRIIKIANELQRCSTLMFPICFHLMWSIFVVGLQHALILMYGMEFPYYQQPVWCWQVHSMDKQGSGCSHLNVRLPFKCPGIWAVWGCRGLIHDAGLPVCWQSHYWDLTNIISDPQNLMSFHTCLAWQDAWFWCSGIKFVRGHMCM